MKPGEYTILPRAHCVEHVEWTPWTPWVDIPQLGGTIVRASSRSCLVCVVHEFRFEPTDRTHDFTQL